ncbi:MAG: hypothetical protein OXC96_08345 [Cyanobacteria bacterium MAG CAR1_bin_15]|nr:hypothetical protein [Cyanobacteria bacterium MAG CAR1_bin_15]
MSAVEATDRGLDMAINEDFAPGVPGEENPQDRPPGIERRGGRRGSGERSGRGTGREQGALRIRLSDNELRAAQLIQERFQLRSTVAALGFSLRTMAQLVEQGQLVVEETTADQLPQHTGPGSRGGGQSARNRTPAPRPDPLARPARQQAKPLNDHQPPTDPAADTEAAMADDSTTDSPPPEET